MFDLSQPNVAPGKCCKCRGSGVYRWGAVVNGRATHQGKCFSCQGTGRQSSVQIARNHAFNRYQLGRILAEG